MLPQRSIWPILATAFTLSAAHFSVAPSAQAQDSQRQAAARVVREKAAAEATANTTPGRGDAEVRDEKSATDQEKLNRRAGERAGAGTLGESQVLGMSVKEAGRGGVKVVKVAASSPAFNAGIREGDELSLIHI